MWRDVEEIGAGDVLRVLSAGALVWGYVDPVGATAKALPPLVPRLLCSRLISLLVH